LLPYQHSSKNYSLKSKKKEIIGRKERVIIYYISVTSIHKRSPTNGGSTFATYTEHTPVFNTVHIIAAVIGILGAIAVAITVCITCKRRRNQQRRNSAQAINCPASTDLESHLTTPSSNINRFGQFASDFDNTVEPPKPAVTHVEDISPMMQQYQLQLMLLQQERQEKTTREQHRASASSTNTNASTSAAVPVTPNSLMPPPPYQP
jgi:heme/copper-type cytochrome/quinol oxidase subunit 1